MPRPRLPIALLFVALLCACLGNPDVQRRADRIVDGMDTRQKIGQKIMMGLRHWCPDSEPTCRDDMVALPPALAATLRDNAIGGVVLLGGNIVDLEQTRRFTGQIRQARAPDNPLGMLIGIDAQGGNAVHLPRPVAAFPGNMALGAAFQGSRDSSLAVAAGRVRATEIRAVGFNVNFAPVVDTNRDPRNPVVNVHAYGDDADTVGLLSGLAAQGARQAGVISAFKHFPGHGGTVSGAHHGSPRVEKPRADAYAADLAPYRHAIESGHAPDMIMTAHIPYPSLDSSEIASRTGEPIMVPATLSRRIQHDLLREELGYRGVSITDAFYMSGIGEHFEPADAVIKAFQADVDIVLMPLDIHTASQVQALSRLMDELVAAVDSGKIDRAELDRSVSRIVQMKLRHRITANGERDALPDLSVIGSPAHREVETRIARASITLLHNEGQVLPLKAPAQRVFILAPRAEQAEAMRRRFVQQGHAATSAAALGEMSWEARKQAMDKADVVVIGTMADAAPPVEKFTGIPPATPDHAQQARNAMEYAKEQGKSVIHVALRAPYDAVDYDDIADATLAAYSCDGDESGLRYPSLPLLVDVMVGASPATGRLPVDIPMPDGSGGVGPVRYARGFGLSL
ncbi:glycoside hydrolase family 3 protein [Bordetella bronchialis]|uniref:glycoside hydrolase family 3 protein n=1 Tax=Bordetella bronchialis TaxID=463025 RepID=UPI000AE16764|nr:glycoside hydrolase family 3 protein [Bordetella bronchialis]